MNAVTVSAARRYVRPQVVSGKGWHSLGTGPETGWGPGPPSWTRPPALSAASGAPIGTTSPGGTRSHVCLTGRMARPVLAPGAKWSVRRSPARRRPQYLPQTGVKQGRPWAQHHRTRRRAGGNGSDGPSCPGHLPAAQQGSPGYERGAHRAPREPGSECSPRAGYRSLGPSRQAPRWSHTRPPCHSTSPGTRCAHCLGGRELASFPTVAPYSVHLAGAA